MSNGHCNDCIQDDDRSAWLSPASHLPETYLEISGYAIREFNRATRTINSEQSQPIAISIDRPIKRLRYRTSRL